MRKLIFSLALYKTKHKLWNINYKYIELKPKGELKNDNSYLEEQSDQS